MKANARARRKCRRRPGGACGTPRPRRTTSNAPKARDDTSSTASKTSRPASNPSSSVSTPARIPPTSTPPAAAAAGGARRTRLVRLLRPPVLRRSFGRRSAALGQTGPSLPARRVRSLRGIASWSRGWIGSPARRGTCSTSSLPSLRSRPASAPSTTREIVNSASAGPGFRHNPHHRGRPPARKAGCSTPVRLDHWRK